MWRATTLFSLFSLIAGIASAEGIQAQCGTESGHTYVLVGGIVPANQGGWQDDSMHGETVVRIDTTTGTADVRFKDATGIWQTVADQGGTVNLWAAQSGPPSFMVTVTYPGATVETLTIGEIENNAGTLVHTLSRVTNRISSSRVMVAQCIVTSY